MQKQFKTEVPFWYTGQCPCVDDDVLVLAPAGEETLLAGVDCLTGEIVWSTPNTLGYKMSHSSVMPMSLSNKRTYVRRCLRRIGGKSGSGYSLMGYKKMAAFRDRSVSITFVIKPDIPCGGLWDGRGSLTSG